MITIANLSLNTKEDRLLLYKYLTKFYGEKQTQIILEKYKDKLWDYGGVAWSLGQKSIEYFCLYYLQDVFTPKKSNQARKLSETHYEVWDLIEQSIIKNEFDKLVLCLPRGFAKTTIVTFGTVIHQTCYRSHYQIVVGKTEADAQGFIFDVRKTLEENEYIKQTFGELIDTKNFIVNKNELCLTNNCKIHALSSTSSIRGKKHLGERPTIIYLDDIQGLDDVITEQAKQKKMETFQKDILYAGDDPVVRDGKVIKNSTKYFISGTVLAKDCFISQLLKDKTYKSIVRKAVLVDDIDELFSNNYWTKFKEIFYDNKNQYAEIDANNYYLDNLEKLKFPVLWEDKWDCKYLALKYFSDPVAFKQEMQNDSTIAVGNKCFFNIKTFSEADLEQIEFEKTMMTVDCAVETGEKNDFSAVCIGSKTSLGHRYIRKGMIYKLHFDESLEVVFNLIKNYEDITHVMVEKNTFQGRFASELRKKIDTDPDLSYRNIVIINERQNANKENRIRSIAGKINNGFIIFNEEDEDFYNQILSYQGSDFGKDDSVDSVEMLDSMIDEIKIKKPIKILNRNIFYRR